MAGVGYALGAAIIWAIASALRASQTARIDSVSIGAVRAIWTIPFWLVALFAFGAFDDLAQLQAGEIAQVIGSGLVGTALGETLYAASVAMLGMTRSFTTVIGIYSLMAYVWSAIFLGESIGWEIAAGSVLIILGVYLVAVYGRPRPLTIGPSSGPSSGRSSGLLTPSSQNVRLPIIGVVRPSVRRGIILALAVGLIWSASLVWLRSVSVGLDAVAVGTVRMPLVALFLLGSALLQRESILRRREIPRRSQGVLAVSGMFGAGLTTLLFILALQEIGAGQTAVLFSTSPLWALPLGFFFLRERITIWVAVGTVIAVGGIAMLSLGR